MRIYKLTDAGRKIGGDISTKKDEQHEVLTYLYGLGKKGTADVDEIAVGTGLPRDKVSGLLHYLQRKRLCTEITGSHNEKEYEF